jgi:hypothetical protein
MTKEQKEQLARQRFIEEALKIGGELTIHQAVEIIERLDLNPRLDRAIYDSHARLAREWIAKDADENGDRCWHNIKRRNEQGEVVQEFVQERLFDAGDYQTVADDETKVLRRTYKKLAGFVDRCYQRYGVKLKVDLSFLQPMRVSRRAVKKAEKAAQKERQPRLTDDI